MSNRLPVAALVLSGSVLVGLAVYEDYRGEAYIPVPGDVPTIGFGETSGVKMGDKTTPVRALIRLQESAEAHAQGVRRCAPIPMLQREFDAFVSLAYNIGVKAFCDSTLVRMLKAGDYAGACKQILRWDKFKGRALAGLTKRRQAEYRTCIGAD
jgi:lysozyme